MFVLKNKTILIVSPQSWGTMYVSKHHYALELAKRGNTVYFLNPPEQDRKGKAFVRIDPSGIHPELLLISHRLIFPYSLKFHALAVFHRLMKFHIKQVLTSIDKPVDIIWSFDLNNLYPFKYFPASALKIFHPVDEPLNKPSIDAAAGAGIIFSVTTEILDKYYALTVPKHLINHGVTDNFICKPQNDYDPSQPPRVGFSGNLLRNDIDRDFFLEIIKQNPAVCFDCWGSYLISQSNIGGNADDAALAFIESLQKQKNIFLHGAVKPEILSAEIRKADAFLICYDVEKDQSKGTNYHKIMEYLGTGKVIISNNVTAYKDRPELVQMVAERNTNRNLPLLFKEVMKNLSYHNSYTLQQARTSFAAANTYQQQIERIETVLEAMSNKDPGPATAMPVKRMV